MKKRVRNKEAKYESEVFAGMTEFIKSLVDKLSYLYQEVEEYHQLKEHLIIILGTKKPRYTIEHNNEELNFIYNELDKQLFFRNDAAK